MKHLICVILTSCAFALLGAGCGELEDFDGDFEALIVELRAADDNAEKPLSNAEELELRQAGASDVYIDRLRKSRTLVNEALETRDSAPIKEAIALRPDDVNPRFYEVAFMIAYNNEPEVRRGMGEISGLLYPIDHPLSDRKFAYTRFAPNHRFLEILLRTRAAFDADSPEWGRLNDAYCANLETYQRIVAALEGAEIHVDPDRFSDSTCP